MIVVTSGGGELVKSRMKAAGFENRLVLSDLRPRSPQPRLTSKGLLPFSQSETAGHGCMQGQEPRARGDVHAPFFSWVQVCRGCVCAWTAVAPR